MKSRAPLLGVRATGGCPPDQGVVARAAALDPLPSSQLGGPYGRAQQGWPTWRLCSRGPQGQAQPIPACACHRGRVGPAHNCP
jgi:hypothetical protein